MSLGLSVVQNLPRVSRKIRRPVHDWYLETPPFCLQLASITPVLAGETLQKIQWQSRVVTQPVKNPFQGWHKEYYWFYVKLTDLAEPYLRPGGEAGEVVEEAAYIDRANIEKMLMLPGYDLTADAGSSSASASEYQSDELQMSWGSYCVNAVWRHYFLDPEEPGDFSVGVLTDTGATGYTWLMAAVNRQGIFHSGVLDAEFDAPEDPAITVGVDDQVTGSEIEAALQRYQLAKRQGLTSVTFDDYLREQGVSVPRDRVVPGRPELLRYQKSWSYPVNTVDPSTGTPSSAVSWVVKEQATKKRFFREPGFVVCVTCARPKVYFSLQTSSAPNFLTRFNDWLPRAMQGDAYSAIREFASGTGPHPTASTAYHVDLADLFMYGDQMLNVPLTETDCGLVALPTTGLQKRYPPLASVNALFATATANKVREDGVAQMTILGTVQDRTAGT